MKAVDLPIITLDIQNEMDVMLAHRRAMQFARFGGIRLPEQTRFATAISEICRNVLEYAKKGTIAFSITDDGNARYLTAKITDKGKGIKNLKAILERTPATHKGRGLGIIYSRRLTDYFDIASSEKGTMVTLQKYVPASDMPLNKLIVQGWVKHLANEPALSAYEELKMRNMQLLELTEELTQNSKLVESQMQEIKTLNDQLTASNHKMKQFTYALSHDLKTPLSSLKLASEYIDANPDSKDLEPFRKIRLRSISRINKTITSLIEIIDAQNRSTGIANTHTFQDIFDSVKEEYAHFISDTKVSMKVNFSKAPEILYIEAYLQSIFHNLMSNALKYRDQKRALSIQISSSVVKGNVHLSFTDNGIGMDLAKIGSRLFVPFNRFSDEPEGKGIGLYLVKEMVEANGGTVTVESTPGKGTTFIFVLVPYSNQ